MGGRAGRPLYAIPVMRNLTAASCSQPGRPAMLTDLSAHTGIGTAGLNGSSVPLSHCSLIGSPFSLWGVWQSWHMPMPSTRYLPRASLAGETRETVFCSPARIDTKPNAIMLTAKICFFTGPSFWGIWGRYFENITRTCRDLWKGVALDQRVAREEVQHGGETPSRHHHAQAFLWRRICGIALCRRERLDICFGVPRALVLRRACRRSRNSRGDVSKQRQRLAFEPQ